MEDRQSCDWQRLVFTGESRKLVLFVHSWWKTDSHVLTEASLHWWKQKAGSVCSQLMEDRHSCDWQRLVFTGESWFCLFTVDEDRQSCGWQRLVFTGESRKLVLFVHSWWRQAAMYWQRLVFTGESWFCLFTVDGRQTAMYWQRLVFTGESRKLVLFVHSWWRQAVMWLTEASLHWWKQKAGSVCSQLMKTGSHVTDRG